MSKWNKRKAKVIGLIKFIYSGATLKYSPLNFNRLLVETSRLGINKIHVGCGGLILKNWLNITYDPREVYGTIKNTGNNAFLLNWNINNGIPVQDQTVDLIAAAHFIEHIDLNECLEFCQKSFKVLRPGGIIRLSCPDLEIYAWNYINGDMKFFNNLEIKKACTYKSAVTPSQIFAAKAYDSGGAHKWFHDFSSLENVLKRVGFSEIRKVGRLEGLMPELEQLELPQREIETVYVEAIK